MAVDWLAIKNDYVNGVGRASDLSKKYGIKAATIRSRAMREGWTPAKQQQRNTVATLCNEKTAAAVAQSEADRIATLTRVGAKAAAFLEKRIDAISDSNNKAYEVKSIMESVKLIRDIYKTDEHRAGMAREDDPLTKSLREEAQRLEHQRQAEADSGLPLDEL